jgi:hypothetical protein
LRLPTAQLPLNVSAKALAGADDVRRGNAANLKEVCTGHCARKDGDVHFELHCNILLSQMCVQVSL